MSDRTDYPDAENSTRSSSALGVFAREALRQVGSITALVSLLWLFGGPATKAYIKETIQTEEYAKQKDLTAVATDLVAIQLDLKERRVIRDAEMDTLRLRDVEIIGDQRELAESVKGLSERLKDFNELLGRLNNRLDNIPMRSGANNLYPEGYMNGKTITPGYRD